MGTLTLLETKHAYSLWCNGGTAKYFVSLWSAKLSWHDKFYQREQVVQVTMSSNTYVSKALHGVEKTWILVFTVHPAPVLLTFTKYRLCRLELRWRPACCRFPTTPCTVLHYFLMNRLSFLRLIRCMRPVGSTDGADPWPVCDQQKVQVPFWRILPQQMRVLTFLWFFLSMLRYKQHNQPLSAALALQKDSFLFHFSITFNIRSSF